MLNELTGTFPFAELSSLSNLGKYFLGGGDLAGR
jgi:hypothetical protein